MPDTSPQSQTSVIKLFSPYLSCAAVLSKEFHINIILAVTLIIQMLLSYLFLLASAEYTRLLGDQQYFTMNGFNDRFMPWQGPVFEQQGRDWDGACASGKAQSPIDITDYPDPPSLLQVVTASNSSFSPIYFENQEDTMVMQFNGLYDMFYMIAGTSRMVNRGVATERVLSVVAVETPAEHTMNGVRYPMSIILGYAGVLPNGDLIRGYQVSILFREGASNPGLAQFMSQSRLDVSAFLPPDGVLDDYYYYVGSFDAPPCWEGMPWIVSNYIVEASREQIAFFQDQYGLQFPEGARGVRAVQPLNGRTIYHFVPDNS